MNMIIELIILLGLVLGSYADIKTREIPDTLSFSLIFLGIATAVCSSILLWSYRPLLGSIIGLAAGVLIGLIAYYTGQWGGGDAKVLMGVGCLIGINIFTIGKDFPIFGVFMINIILIGAIYGLIWLLGLAIKNYHTFRPAFREARRRTNIVRLRIVLLLAVVIFTIIVFIVKPDFLIITLIYLILVMAVILTYLSIIIKTIEKTCLIKKINVSKLTEGDWIIEKIKFKSKKEQKDADKYIYTKTGISTEGIKMLKKTGKKTITVKEGIPFLPSFLIAYVLLLILRNWIHF